MSRAVQDQVCSADRGIHGGIHGKIIIFILIVCLGLTMLSMHSFAVAEETDTASNSSLSVANAADASETFTYKEGDFVFTVTTPKTTYKAGETASFALSVENVNSLLSNAQIEAGKEPLTSYRLYSFTRVSDGTMISSPTQYGLASPYEYTLSVPGTYTIVFQVCVKIPTGEYNDAGNPTYSFVNKEDRSKVSITFTVTDDGSVSAQDVVNQVVQQCQSMNYTTDYDKALFFHDWLIEHCTYVGDLVDIDTMLVSGRGNCEAYHGAYVRFLKEVGITTEKVGNGFDNHRWTAAKLDGKWYQIDVTWDDATWKALDGYPENEHLYFGLTDEIIQLTHTGHTKPVEGCESTSLDNNYFIKTGKIVQWSQPYEAIINEAIANHETSKTIDPLNKDWPTWYNSSRLTINSLVAYQLNTQDWSNDEYTVTLNAVYDPGERDSSKAFIKPDSFTFTLSYTKKDAGNTGNTGDNTGDNIGDNTGGAGDNTGGTTGGDSGSTGGEDPGNTGNTGNNPGDNAGDTGQPSVEVDMTDLLGPGSSTSDIELYLDGVKTSASVTDGKVSVAIDGNAPRVMTYYEYNKSDPDPHAIYPTNMHAWMIQPSADGSSYTATRFSALDDFLAYAGCSIRVTGKKGIRMITSVSSDVKSRMTSTGIDGWKLVETGTVIAWANNVPDGTLTAETTGAVRGVAYAAGSKDPVYDVSNGRTSFTNVLLLPETTSASDLKRDLAMRPYAVLVDAAGNEATVYGGTLYRSIEYIAGQNANAFKTGTSAYNYIQSILASCK